MDITTNSLQFWLVLIPVITTSVVAIITAMKVQKVHTLVNSAMTEQKVENAMLRNLLTAKQVEIDSAERARIALASVAASTPVQVAAAEPLPVTVAESERIIKP